MKTGRPKKNPLFMIYIFYMVELTRDRKNQTRLTVNSACPVLAKQLTAEFKRVSGIGTFAEAFGTEVNGDTVRDWYKTSKATIGDDQIAHKHLDIMRKMRDDMGANTSAIDVINEFDRLVKRGNLSLIEKGELPTFTPAR